MKEELCTPRTQTVKRLFAVAGNRCAFPQCSIPVVDPSGTILAEICHIKGRKPDAKRYDNSQTAEERHAFDNLLLLCCNHHKVIDDDEGSYTIARLQEMKAKHESEATAVPEPNDAVASSLITHLETTYQSTRHHVGNIIVRDNVGHTQINIGSPGSQQVVTAKRELLPTYDTTHKNDGTEFTLILTFYQTAGHWEQGVPLEVEVRTSGPYETARFVSGLPMALMEVETTQGAPEAASKGYFLLKTATAPRPAEPLVLEIKSKTRVTPIEVTLRPVRGKTA